MNVRNALITTIITAGLVSSAAYADDFNTVIENDRAASNISQSNAVNPNITIQDYIDAARKEDSSISNVTTANNASRWELERVL